MNEDFIESVFANPSILALGAPLISACLQLGQLGLSEDESSHRASVGGLDRGSRRSSLRAAKGSSRD